MNVARLQPEPVHGRKSADRVTTLAMAHQFRLCRCSGGEIQQQRIVGFGRPVRREDFRKLVRLLVIQPTVLHGWGVDDNANELLRAKTFEVLTYLVERPGRLVTKIELIEAVWPDAAITDNSLAQCLVEIRRALGDDSQQLIRTVARRGYVFAAPGGAPVVEFHRKIVRYSSSERKMLPAGSTETPATEERFAEEAEVG